MKIVIPARKGSKGLPFKNRKLLHHTLNIIPDEYKHDTWITTDDKAIIIEADKLGFKTHLRHSSLAKDESSTKEVMQDFVNKQCNPRGETVIMLYLTYPERTWEDVMNAKNFYDNNTPVGTGSLLCKKEIKTSPFLMLKEENNNRGSQLFYHDLYRRQDYPKCFEISHFICIFAAQYINNLNNNMYDRDTVYMEIPNVTDVDTQKDLDELDGTL